MVGDRHKLRSPCCVLLLWAHTFSSALYSQAHSISFVSLRRRPGFTPLQDKHNRLATELKEQTAVVVLYTCGPQLTLTNSNGCRAHHALAINRGQGVDCNILPSEACNIWVLNLYTSVPRHCYQYCYVLLQFIAAYGLRDTDLFNAWQWSRRQIWPLRILKIHRLLITTNKSPDIERTVTLWSFEVHRPRYIGLQLVWY